jgi:hypothetical protein
VSLYQGDRRLSRSEALESVQVPITQASQPILRLPGATLPGRLFFTVEEPGQGERAGVLLEVFRERERTRGLSRFKVMSIGTTGAVGSNFIEPLGVVGGGHSDFTGGLTVVATDLGGVAPTLNAWVDFAPSPAPSVGRCPFAMDTSIAAGAIAEFGPPPFGATKVSLYTDGVAGAGGIVGAWIDSAGAVAANWTSGEFGGPHVAMAGYSLAIQNHGGGAALVGVGWT